MAEKQPQNLPLILGAFLVIGLLTLAFTLDHEVPIKINNSATTPDPSPHSQDKDQAHSDPADNVEPLEIPDDSQPEFISKSSKVLVFEVTAQKALLLEAIAKTIPFEFSEEQRGDYWLRLKNQGGDELHMLSFNMRDLCPHEGPEHQQPHGIGHIMLEHKGSILIRVPEFEDAHTLELWRLSPQVDKEPKRLGQWSYPLKADRS